MGHSVRNTLVCLCLLAIVGFSGQFLCNCLAQKTDDEAAAEEPLSINPFAAPPLDGLAKLPPDAKLLGDMYANVFPDGRWARPPYLPGRYDPHLKPPKDEDDSSGKSPPRHFREHAFARQSKLEDMWSRLKKINFKPKTPDEKAKFAMLRYAMGEGPLDAAMMAARAAGDRQRLRMAELLMEECRFDEALRELTALGEGKIDLKKKDPPPIANRALEMLVDYVDDRRDLRTRVPVLPTEVDVDEYLRRRQEDPTTRALIDALRTLSVQPFRTADEEIFQLEALDMSRGGRVWFDTLSFGSRASRLTARYLEDNLLDPEHRHLVATGNEFVLYREGCEWLDGDRAEFNLFSIFNGPIRFRLYHFTSHDQWQQVDAEALGKLKPSRQWSKTFAPLKDNNRCAPVRRTVTVENLDEGYYLLLADARYAPMAAACKFLVSDVALYIRAGDNRGFVMAVNRRSGRPVTDLPLKLNITGNPTREKNNDDSTPSVDLDEPFGVDTADDDPAEEIVSTMRRLRAAQQRAQERLTEQERPDFEQTLDLTTGKDGGVAFDLDLKRPKYQYRLNVERHQQGLDAAPLTQTQLEYSNGEPPFDKTKVVVWTDQPIHRPGDTVNFKGIVRHFNGLRVADHDPKKRPSVRVKVRNYDGVMWEEDCEVSKTGTFGGSFSIPVAATLGQCHFYVDGQGAAPSPPLVVAEYRLPTYRVILDTPDRTHAGGEQLKGTVDVQYITGRQAGGVEVELVMETDEENPPSLVTYTNDDGRAEFSMPLPLVENSESFVLRAVVADASGHSYTRVDRVHLSPNAFHVDATPRRSRAIRGQSVPITIEVSSWRREPIAGATVIIDGQKQSATTDKLGIATLPFHVKGKDDYQAANVTVVSNEKVVRAVSSGINVIPNPNQTAETPADKTEELPPPEPDVHVRDMPRRINAGDPLSFTLNVEGDPDKKYAVCLFTENTGMLKSQVLSLSPGDHKITIETLRAWAPSLKCTATLLDGKRIESDWDRCYLLPREKFLTLEIETDRDDYKPGEKCVSELKVVDYRGRPVARADISLGVVDEAVYQLLYDPTPDLQTFFHQYHVPYPCKQNYDSTAPRCKSLWYWLGPRYAWGYYTDGVLCGRRGRLSARGGGTPGSGRRLRIRQHFQETAHWVANLVTDENGRARTTFTLPDNITQWRFTARGVTADTKVGQVKVTRRSMLPLQVELAMPRGFRAGDSIDLPVMLHNNTDASLTVHGTTRLNQAEAKPWPRITLSENGDHAFTIPVSAKTDGKTLVYASATDAEGTLGDAIEKTLVALPYGYPTTQSFTGALHKPAVIVPKRVGMLTDRGLTISVRRETGLAGPISSAMDSLIQYPYGCVEQTMSRFMPAVVAGRALEGAKLENRSAEKLPDVIAKSIARLASFQHEDGGWGWWRDDKTNDFMTAYVLRGLALCDTLDVDVPRKMIDGAEFHLLKRLNEGRLQGSAPASFRNVHYNIYASHALATSLHRYPKEAEKAIAEVLSALEKLAIVKISGDASKIVGLGIW